MDDAALPRWDRRNPNEQGLVKDTQYQKLLNQQLTTLRQVLRTKDLWAHLIAMEAIDDLEERTFQVGLQNTIIFSKTLIT